MDVREKEKSLAKLIAVHGQLRTFHEGRRAGFLRDAAGARAEAAALMRRFDEADSFGSLFPELYHARIAAALQREAEANALAEAEAEKLALVALREKRIAEELAEVRGRIERATTERGALDWVEARIAAGT